MKPLNPGGQITMMDICLVYNVPPWFVDPHDHPKNLTNRLIWLAARIQLRIKRWLR